jgi:4-amino-4-deoxy-L-arabinose transferase-like glycosyltransferase
MKKSLLYQVLILIGAALLFIPFLGRVHLFDWDEINFAESAREMLVTHDYLTVRIFFEPFWEKPPLFIWMQVLSMKLFGVNEFAARFPNAICGIATLLLIFNVGRKLFDNRFGLLWVLAYCCSILPFLYFKSGIIDPWFNLFIFLSIFFWVYSIETKRRNTKIAFSFLSASCLGLAVLTKGPVSILVFGLVVFVLFFLNGFRIGLNWKHIAVFVITLAIVGGFWFILQLISGNADIIFDFIVYQIRLFKTKDAGHGGFPLYHFIILLLGVFPASIFAIQGHKYSGIRDMRKVFHITMVILLWVVLLLFSLVRTKIVHYSSLTYFPLTYLCAYSCYMIMKGKYQFRIWQKSLLLFIGSLLSLIVIILPIFIAKKQYLIEKGFIHHSFTIGNLEADPGWTWLHSSIGVIFIAGITLAIILSSKNIRAGILSLFLSSLLFIYLSLGFITPGAERISQRASIDFIEEQARKDVYIQSFFKSYAILFYTQQQVPADRKIFDIDWLSSGEIDKDAYFILRIDKKEEILKSHPNIHVLYQKNGYVFCIRKAVVTGSNTHD